MKQVVHHVRSHLVWHIRDHKHHYVFGVFGGFALFKLFLLLSSIPILQYMVFANAPDPIDEPTSLVEEISDSTWVVVDSTWVVATDDMCDMGTVVWNSPLTWNIFSGVFAISWSVSGNTCFGDDVRLQLWDHNAQRVDVAVVESGVQDYIFDSVRLSHFQSSGLYHVLGIHISGQEYRVYTWLYDWLYTGAFSGYMMRLIDPNDKVLSQSDMFAIDNQAPSLTWLLLSSQAVTSWYVWLGGVVSLSFVADELLTGVIVSLWSGISPTSFSVSWLYYTYTWQLNSLCPQWPLSVSVSFADLVGHTWSRLVSSSLIFDIASPTVTWFVFSGIDSGVQLRFVSSEPAILSYVYGHTWVRTTGAVSVFTAHHVVDFLSILPNTKYGFELSLLDQARNPRVVTWTFLKNTSGQIVSSVVIVPLVHEEVLSGQVQDLVAVLKAEVEKYMRCKEAIVFTPVEIEIRRNAFTLQMPDFKKSQVRQLVTAFTLFVLEKVKSDYTLSVHDIQELTQKFDSFLVIAKLLRDDDNLCKQNLSNYHISQFSRAMEEYGIALD